MESGEKELLGGLEEKDAQEMLSHVEETTDIDPFTVAIKQIMDTFRTKLEAEAKEKIDERVRQLSAAIKDLTGLDLDI